MRFVMSNHILRDKIPLLDKKGFKINQKQIKDVIEKPEHLDFESDAPKIIDSKSFEKKHTAGCT